jgi:pyruvate,water dikinase
MAVGCLEMIPAKASGVIYTVDPNAPQTEEMIVTAAPGLGVLVVEGRGKTDMFKLSCNEHHRILERKIADKQEMCVAAKDEGTSIVPIPAELRSKTSISDDTLTELAGMALRIERHMRCPQDIEWAVSDTGKITILQTRPLHLGPKARPQVEELLAARERYRVLLQNCGEVACRGIGAGKVFLAGAEESTVGFAPGDVLVTQFASPHFSTAVASAAALVCETGSVTGHLATVAREYRVPAIMGASNAMSLLKRGETITVDADDHIIYEGQVNELLRYQLLRSRPYNEAPEFRALRRFLRHVSPLHLRDPKAANFTPEHCRSFHDIIRFAHERALVELSRLEGIDLNGRTTNARTMDLDIPLDLVVIDLGGGISQDQKSGPLTKDQIVSRPLSSLLEGLLAPGVWSTNPADMDLEGFMASATRAGPLTIPGNVTVQRNVAIISADYLNISLRVGYHFNVVDCLLSEEPGQSYIFFRFVGGVTDITRRTRRAQLLADILGQQEFKTELNGELVIGRIQGAPHSIVEERLQMVGRLIGFSRQLDILLRDDSTVKRLANAFLQGRYHTTYDVPTKEQKL